MNNKQIKVLLYGTGAVGSFYAGKISQAGATVDVVARSDYEVVKKQGIKIKSILGDFHFKPGRVLKSGSEYNENPDYIIVATKVLPEIDIYNLIKDSVTSKSSIVLLQNGIDIEKSVFEKFPDNEIISALAFICVSRKSYGVVDHQDYGRIIIGRYPGGNSEKVKTLEFLLNQSGLPVESTDDVINARWKKLLWNAPFNPLSVICAGSDTKELLKNKNIKELCIEIMKEVLLLASADGHPLDDSMIIKNIDDTINMTPYKTSMLLDYENKRPMEVDAILGNAIKIGEKLNVYPTRIKTLYTLLSIINEKNLKF